MVFSRLSRKAQGIFRKMAQLHPLFFVENAEDTKVTRLPLTVNKITIIMGTQVNRVNKTRPRRKRLCQKCFYVSRKSIIAQCVNFRNGEFQKLAAAAIKTAPCGNTERLAVTSADWKAPNPLIAYSVLKPFCCAAFSTPLTPLCATS